LAEDQPVISVVTKKKELVGAFKNNGRKWVSIREAPQVQGQSLVERGQAA